MFLAPNYNTMDRLGKKPYSMHNQGMRPALNQMGDSVSTVSKGGLGFGLGYLFWKSRSGQSKKWHTTDCIDTDYTVL